MILKPNKGGASVLDMGNFNQETTRMKMAQMIILHEYPLSIVEHSGFRDCD